MAKKKELDHDKPDRKFCAMLYEDSETYVFDEVLTKMVEYADEWSYIRHDRDIDENEEFKKPHYHVCMKFRTPRVRSTVAKQIGVEKNYIERAKNWRGANRYLMHLDDEDKYQYGLYDVESNFDYVNLTNAKEAESVKVSELMLFIHTECKNLVELADYANAHNLWSEYRRNYMILKDYFYEAQRMKGKDLNHG